MTDDNLKQDIADLQRVQAEFRGVVIAHYGALRKLLLQGIHSIDHILTLMDQANYGKPRLVDPPENTDDH